MTRLVRLVLVLAPGPLVASACPSLDPFACLDDQQCTLMADGVCHENGACSYPDDECDSGHRWSQTAGALAGACVEAGVTTSDTTSTSEPTGASGDASSSGPLPQPECGNGVMEGDEECDDLDPSDCNACTPECRLAGQLRWSTTYDGGFADFFDTVVVDQNGDAIAVGRTSMGPTEADKNRVAARYDANGEELWVTTEDRPGRDDLNCVVLSARGEIIAAGIRISDAGDEELWVGRYDDGLVEDLLPYGDVEPLPTQAQGCVFTTDERLVVVGMIEGTGEGFEKWDRLVLYDALGDPQPLALRGITPIMPGARDIAYEVAAAPDGGFLAAGNVTTTDTTKASERWMARFDGSGAYDAHYVDGGPGQGQEEILGVAHRDGEVFAVGSQVFNDGGTEQTWIARFGFEGLTFEWDVELGLPPAATVVDLELDADGSLLVAVDVEGGPGLDDDGTAVAALDPADGACRWLVHDPGGMRRAGGLAVAPDGTLAVVGADAPTDEPETNAIVVSLSP